MSARASLVRRVEQRGGARRGERGTGFLEFLASLQRGGGGRRRARAGRRRERGIFAASRTARAFSSAGVSRAFFLSAQSPALHTDCVSPG